MTREEFIKQAKELAVEFCTKNLSKDFYESNFIKLLNKYENKQDNEFKLGSTVKVISNKSFHGFKINEIVTIIEIDSLGDIKATNEFVEWYLSVKDIEHI